MSLDTIVGRAVSSIDPFSHEFLRDPCPRHAFARRVASFEVTGKPQPRLNNTLRGLDTLPLRIVPV